MEVRWRETRLAIRDVCGRARARVTLLRINALQAK